jgi:alkylresorcinol/alkylpyrone synthase
MPPHLLAIKSATPPYVLNQVDVTRRASHLFRDRRDIERLLPIFENTGIKSRYSCVPIDWYESDHSWRERTALYIENSLDLIDRVAKDLLAEAKLAPESIDAIVVASTTGIATPSLDARLVHRLNLRKDIKRLPIFGLGCAGGVVGMARAADLARAMPGARVLFLVVELCALTFRKNDLSKSNLVATALFGDGAAGAILSTRGEGPAFGPAGEYMWPDSLGVMGWDVEEDGLKPIFSTSIPSLVASDFRRALSQFLSASDLPRSSLDNFACHPGGAKVLDALEDSLDLNRGDLTFSRGVLRDFGNMSAATALFVLERMPRNQSILLTAMGPGFSAAFQILDGT